MRRLSSEVIKKAFVDSIPIMAGYVFIGIGFGIIMVDKGMGIWWVLAACVLIYSGAMQFVTINLITGGASFVASAVTALMVSCRHLFYGISMIDGYKGAGWKKPYLIYALTDETYALVCRDNLPEGMDKHTYSFLVSLFNQCYWLIGCALGALAGSVIAFSTEGIDFAMTALFVSIFVDQWTETKDRSSALTGVGVSLLCLIIFGPQHFLIPTMIGITGVLTLIELIRTKRRAIDPFEKGGDQND
ncbi:MAG: AzlC family ABC transporter permease [Firmicutes bacterium]|nr:AzlC family ABC transporter permease [Bacillota bacterium]